jgi:predicted RNA-binding protein with PIN domain
MPVPVIIDGYNLLYAQGEAPAPESRARLVRELVGWARARNRRVVLVFDAWDGGTREARTEAHGPVTVWFTRAGERADAFIVRWVGEHTESVVITSDREVQQGARRRGAAVLDADSFAARLEGDAPPPGAGPPRGRPRGAQAAWLRGL